MVALKDGTCWNICHGTSNRVALGLRERGYRVEIKLTPSQGPENVSELLQGLTLKTGQPRPRYNNNTPFLADFSSVDIKYGI